MKKVPHLLDIIAIDRLGQMQDTFCESLGCAGIVTDPGGNYLIPSSQYSDLCTVVQQTPEGRKQCLLTAQRACSAFAYNQRPVTYKCHLGLMDCAAPIFFRGDLIGSFLVGQFISEDTDINELRRKLRRYGINHEQITSLLNTLYSASEEKISTCLKLDSLLCDMLTELTKKHFYYLHPESALEKLQAVDPLASKVNSSDINSQCKDGSSAENERLWLDMIGNCTEIQSIRRTVRRIADLDIPVLIQGETGVGKELVAKAIHRLSNRSDGPFVAVNCNAVPENLIESELFGYEKGAFTGAVKKSKGKFHLAHKGTLFLDEIGDVKIDFQKKLLRALEEKCIVPLGGNNTIDTDFRLITATSQSLTEKMERGEFRSDLYYRISGIPLLVPPLRDRKNDICLIAQYFLDKYNAKLKRHLVFSQSAKDMLEKQAWKGNVRELKHVIYRSAILKENSDVLSSKDISLDLNSSQSEGFRNREGLLKEYAHRKLDEGIYFKKEMESFEQILITEALIKSQNVTSASKLLSIPRTTLLGKLKKLRPTGSPRQI
ncbi:MAG: sigma 54-interacting transcriptional regulator [Syntrophobacteraceae bacterium]